MMNQRITPIHKVYATLLLAVTCLTACGDISDLATPRGEASDGVPLCVFAQADAETSVTRALEPMASGSMGIFRLAVNDYPAQKNAQYTKADAAAAWLPATADQTVYLGASFARLCAYSPYNAVAFDATVPTKAILTAQAYKSAKDMSYATDGGSAIWKKTPQATFDLVRGYTRLTLSVTRDAAEYLQPCKISQVKLVPASGTYFQTKTVDISTGTVADGATATNFTWLSAAEGWDVKDGIAPDGNNQSIDVLLPPQTLGTGANTLTLTADGTSYSASIPAATLSTLTVGNRYILSVRMKSKAIHVTAVTITDWEPVDVAGPGNDYDSTFD